MDNLALIKRSELARLGHQKLINSDAEVTKTGINISTNTTKNIGVTLMILSDTIKVKFN